MHLPRSTTRRSGGRRRRPDRSGMVVVEFAICSALLFFFFFSAIDFARANLVRHVINNAAFEAARTGVIPGATATRIRDRAEEILSWGYVQGATIVVTPSNIRDTTEVVSVEINVPMSQNQWVLNWLFSDKVMTRTSTVVRESY